MALHAFGVVVASARQGAKQSLAITARLLRRLWRLAMTIPHQTYYR